MNFTLQHCSALLAHCEWVLIRGHWRMELVSAFFLILNILFGERQSRSCPCTWGHAPQVIPAVSASLRSHSQDCSLTHCCFLIALFHSAELWRTPACPVGELNTRGKVRECAVAAAASPSKAALHLTFGGTGSLEGGVFKAAPRAPLNFCAIGCWKDRPTLLFL